MLTKEEIYIHKINDSDNLSKRTEYNNYRQRVQLYKETDLIFCYKHLLSILDQIKPLFFKKK
jgi:hypothetical protein